jgi:hypothetical protein
MSQFKRGRPMLRRNGTVVLIPKPERIRSPKHLKWLKTLPCSVPLCPRRDVVPHHLMCAQPKAMKKKAGDQWAVPLCVVHHDARSGASVHAHGGERLWWERHGVDPIALAERLWATGPAAIK